MIEKVIVEKQIFINGEYYSQKKSFSDFDAARDYIVTNKLTSVKVLVIYSK